MKNDQQVVSYIKEANTYVSPEVSSRVDKDLLPTTERISNRLSYFCMWLCGCVVIGTFTAGSSVFGVLNLTQSIVAMLLGNIGIAIALVLNGRAGHTYGIPMTVQLRTSFGIGGARIAGLIRAVPALIWFGFQSWVGGEALNLVLKTLFGFDNVIVCFVVFHVAQIILAMRGFSGIKWLENVGAVFIFITLLYMTYVTVTKYGTTISDSVVNIKGSWGLPFWGGVTVFLGLYTGGGSDNQADAAHKQRGRKDS